MIIVIHITVNSTAVDGAAPNNTNKKVIFKNCAPFISCISKINNVDIDNAKYNRYSNANVQFNRI